MQERFCKIFTISELRKILKKNEADRQGHGSSTARTIIACQSTYGRRVCSQGIERTDRNGGLGTKYNEVVEQIKSAILQSQLEAAKAVNRYLLAGDFIKHDFCSNCIQCVCAIEYPITSTLRA